jgi:hypothetical protein
MRALLALLASVAIVAAQIPVEPVPTPTPPPALPEFQATLDASAVATLLSLFSFPDGPPEIGDVWYFEGQRQGDVIKVILRIKLPESDPD